MWLAIHHEPEGDGDLALWAEMQRKIAPIVHARTDNVAYSVIYTAWSTYGNGSNTVASKWPGDSYVDILAIDAYNDYGAMRSGRLITNSLDIKTYFEKMAARSEAHGTAWAMAETGQTPAGADFEPALLQARASQEPRLERQPPLRSPGRSWPVAITEVGVSPH